MELVAKTFKGIEDILAAELEELGAQNIRIANRAVLFEGDKALMYRANMSLRTALHILMPITSFTIKREEDLYNNIMNIKWEKLFSVDKTISLHATSNSLLYKNSMYVALKAKDAIVDHFRAIYGERPSVDPKNPNVVIDIHISNDVCTVSLDSSGESLHKRGYRIKTNAAPINEVLAAAMILRTGWKGECNFYDPMCGSGTIPIEAALIAQNIAPGIFRQSFGFEHWADFDADLFSEIYNDDENEREFEHAIYASDVSPISLDIAKLNIKNANLQNVIKVKRGPFEDLKLANEPGIIVMNPPYGERLEKSFIEDFYEVIGDKLKQDCTGYSAWIISSNFDAMKKIGLKATEKHTMYNGALECKFQKYELFEGARKDFLEEQNQED
ncbi:MAG: THUMP domain-containing class I SAM-dependent RNA methyltransferase [Marinifilaceae bacterium]